MNEEIRQLIEDTREHIENTDWTHDATEGDWILLVRKLLDELEEQIYLNEGE